MKKSSKSKGPAVPVQAESELTGLINKIQQQLVFLEKKIDTLILRTPEKSYEVREQPKPLWILTPALTFLYAVAARVWA